ncbi:MAG TPA: class I SAM-dependent methyltransferase [Myxococcota bacterium]|nr:class I SAM-dependent methyltransferase [Myxococcota bacterium]
MSGSDETSKATEIFDDLSIFRDWDVDYYPPLALRLYDRSVGDMLDRLEIPPGGEVLDAGCGPGVHSIRAAKRGLRVRAVDVSETVLAEARRRAEAAGVAEAIEFSREDLTRLGLAPASVSRAFSWGVVIHIPEVGLALDGLARVLAPGGRLALQITNAAAFDHKLERLGRALLGRSTPVDDVEFGPGAFHGPEGARLWVWHLDFAAVERHLARQGLVLLERRAVELTHLQRRAPRWIRPLLLRLNDLWYRLGGPPGPAVTNLAIFEKRAPGR